MKFSELEKNWEQFGKEDPFWAILTDNTKKGNKWDKNDFFKTGKTFVSWVVKRQDELDITVKREHALDFGCGVGRLSQALCEHYDYVTGVDISTSMIELAQKYNQYGNRCIYLINQKTDLSLFQNNTFDAIYSIFVLQHMEPQYSSKYIKEFLRLLKPGGMLVFQLPDKMIDEKKISRPLKKILKLIFEKIQQLRRAPVMEMHCLEQQDIIELIEQHNGKIIKIEEDGGAGPAYLSYTYWVIR